MPNPTPVAMPLEEIITPVKKIPDWVFKVLAWILCGVLAGSTALGVVQSKVTALELRQTQHETMQQEHEREDIRDKEIVRKQSVTIDQFNQFQGDLIRRLDRIENKVDKVFERK